MQKWSIAVGICFVLSACAPENDRFIQPNAASQSMAASDVVAVSDVVSMQPMAHIGASMVSAAASPMAASQPAIIAASAASATAASAASAPAVVPDNHQGKKIPIGGSTEFGNTMYYFPASIKKDGKLWRVVTENRFDKPQKLPESGKTFQYSRITEAVDCERRLTDPVSVTHFSPKDEKVESHTFPYPDYSKWTPLELQALADEHPDSAFIAAVCQIAKK